MLKGAALLVLGLFAALQLVPFGRSHDNPPVLAEPPWDSPATRATFMRSCADCHSNQTRWPWYSHIAPASWLVQHDVDEARAEFNASEWGRPENEAEHAHDLVASGEMPLRQYLWLHPKARLTPEERAAFARGLAATLGDS